MGQQAISRPTRNSSRILITFSLAIWFINFYDVSFFHFKFYEITFSPDLNYCIFQYILMGFILLNHIINWTGDLLSFKGWNTEEKVTMKAGFGSATSVVSRLDSILINIEEKINNQHEDYLKQIYKQLKEIKNDIKKIYSFAILYIWGWYLIVPLAFFLIALIWPGKCSLCGIER